jgi:hypothetical protein
MRHPEGKKTLTTASLISASKPLPVRSNARTPSRRPAATPLDEFPSATRPELYSFFLFN